MHQAPSPIGQYSVFNTGLVNKDYQYIYALFERNVGDQPWKFHQFCVPGIKRGGRSLAENFSTLPKPAHYFNDISDVVYMISKDWKPDEQLPDLQPDHYFIDHPERLPKHFLLDACRKSDKITQLLKLDTTKMSPTDLVDYWSSILNSFACVFYNVNLLLFLSLFASLLINILTRKNCEVKTESENQHFLS